MPLKNINVATQIGPYGLLYRNVRVHESHRLYKSAEQRFSFKIDTMGGPNFGWMWVNKR